MLRLLVFFISIFCLSIDMIFPAARPVAPAMKPVSISHEEIFDGYSITYDYDPDGCTIRFHDVGELCTDDDFAVDGATGEAKEQVSGASEISFLRPGEISEGFNNFFNKKFAYNTVKGFCAGINRRREFLDSSPDLEITAEFQELVLDDEEIQDKKIALTDGPVAAITMADIEKLRIFLRCVTWNIRQARAYDCRGSYSLLQIEVIIYCWLLDRISDVPDDILNAVRDSMFELFLKKFDSFDDRATFQIKDLKEFDNYSMVTLDTIINKYDLLLLVDILPRACGCGNRALISFLLPIIREARSDVGFKKKLYSACVSHAARGLQRDVLIYLFNNKEICSYETLCHVFEDAINGIKRYDEKYPDQSLEAFAYTVVHYFLRDSCKRLKRRLFIDLPHALVSVYCTSKAKGLQDDRVLELIRGVLGCVNVENCFSRAGLQKIYLRALAQAETSHDREIIGGLFNTILL